MLGACRIVNNEYVGASCCTRQHLMEDVAASASVS
jgi:hypothetical protein